MKVEKLLRVEDVQKDSILRHISFSMDEGEMLAIMGPSGSGKSTLLYNVSTLDQPSEGSVWLADTEITKLSEDESAKLRLEKTGFVFQQMNMAADLSILDNILLPAVYADRKKHRHRQNELLTRARELMRKLSIGGIEDRRTNEVSGGQLQRACICRSLINEPEILFADEPTGSLNRSAADGVVGELIKLNGEGMGILVVTHDSRVASACDRILYLLDGQICGQLDFQKDSGAARKGRETAVTEWLSDMGW